MITRKLLSVTPILLLVLLPFILFSQKEPKIMVITTVHINPDEEFTRDQWLAHEKEYFDKVTAKNDLILGSNVLVHYFTPDNSEVLFVTSYGSWEDIEKAGEKNDELARAAWPDSVKRKAFFDKQSSFYTNKHSDEIRSILQGTKPLPPDTMQHIYYVRITHLAYPKDGTNAEAAALMKEYNDNVVYKNNLVKGYYPSRHFWGADSREFVQAFVYDSLGDLEKTADITEGLTKAHWPNETARKAFFDKMDKYFEPWHGDMIYRNVPGLRKVPVASK